MDTKKGLETLAVAIFLVIILKVGWLYVHEGTHFIVCSLEGKTGPMNINPCNDYSNVSCDDETSFWLLRLLNIISPYLLSILLTLAFAKIETHLHITDYKTYLRLLPHLIIIASGITIIGTAMVAAVHPIQEAPTDIRSLVDAFGMNSYLAFLLLISLFVAQLIPYYSYYRKDFSNSRVVCFFLLAGISYFGGQTLMCTIIRTVLHFQ